MIKFRGYDCEVSFQQYGNGRVALLLESGEDNIAVATVNIPSEDLEEDEVIIKDYSENEGILQILIEAGIVSPPIRFVATGWVECPIVKLLKTN